LAPYAIVSLIVGAFPSRDTQLYALVPIIVRGHTSRAVCARVSDGVILLALYALVSLIIIDTPFLRSAVSACVLALYALVSLITSGFIDILLALYALCRARPSHCERSHFLRCMRLSL
jgi:hypothetical protein